MIDLASYVFGICAGVFFHYLLVKLRERSG
jgi:hypothetical protein